MIFGPSGHDHDLPNQFVYFGDTKLLKKKRRKFGIISGQYYSGRSHNFKNRKCWGIRVPTDLEIRKLGCLIFRDLETLQLRNL